MRWILLFTILSVNGQETIQPPEEVDGQDVDVDIKDKEADLKSLKECITGLEFYILDKKQYKKYCPDKKWEQPSIDKYKEKPQSYLPEGCMPEEKQNDEAS